MHFVFIELKMLNTEFKKSRPLSNSRVWYLHSITWYGYMIFSHTSCERPSNHPHAHSTIYRDSSSSSSSSLAQQPLLSQGLLQNLMPTVPIPCSIPPFSSPPPPNFLASTVTPSSHLSFGLLLCLLPSTTATKFTEIKVSFVGGGGQYELSDSCYY